jgi:hypothetical protein
MMIMNFVAGLIAGFLIGSFVAFAIMVFMFSCGRLSKEQDAYRKGYEDGMAQVKEGEVNEKNNF